MDGFIDLFGEVGEVYCVNTRRAAPKVDDTTVFMMKHKSGVVTTTTCGLASGVSYCVGVFGTNGIAETVRPSLDTFRFLPAPGKDIEPETVDHKGFDPINASIEAFASAVAGEAPYPIGYDEILHGVAVFEAIVKSAKTGEPVKVK
jgi:predicted dehydrogenase